MLSQLTVANYAIAEQVELSFSQGMTALTGETGAGKSIVLDALGLVMGARADAGAVRDGAEKPTSAPSLISNAFPRRVPGSNRRISNRTTTAYSGGLSVRMVVHAATSMANPAPFRT